MLNQPKTLLTTLKHGNQKSAAVLVHCAAQLLIHLPLVTESIEGDTGTTTCKAQIDNWMCVCKAVKITSVISLFSYELTDGLS